MKIFLRITISVVAFKILGCLFCYASPVHISSEMNKIYLPFSTLNRTSYSDLVSRSSDGYGAYRIYGHLHSGLDIKGNFGEEVYAIGNGKVIAKWYSFPNLAVVIEHSLTNGSIVYTSYVHLGKIFVNVGDSVNENSVIGRLFNETEQNKVEWQLTHLHFEVRKSLDDNGKASYSCKSLDALNLIFYNPLIWLEQMLKQGMLKE